MDLRPFAETIENEFIPKLHSFLYESADPLARSVVHEVLSGLYRILSHIRTEEEKAYQKESTKQFCKDCGAQLRKDGECPHQEECTECGDIFCGQGPHFAEGSKCRG